MTLLLSKLNSPATRFTDSQSTHATKSADNNTIRNAPLVSVIVPVYNAEKYLAQCLDSIGKQNYPNLEIIIINDGSKDKSKEIIDNYQYNNIRVRTIHKKNEGVSAARNQGINLAKGEYITFVDADDVIHKNFVFNLVNDLIDSHADIVTTSATFTTISDEVFLSKEIAVYASYQEYLPSRALIALYKGTLEKGRNGTQMFRRELINNFCILYNTSMTICEDYDFLARAILKSNKVVVDNRSMYFYRDNISSALHTMDVKQHFDSMNNRQSAGRLAINHFPEILPYLNINLLLDSISIGSLMYAAKYDYLYEYQQLITNIKSYRYKLALSPKLNNVNRTKVFIIIFLGINMGFKINRMIIKVKGFKLI